jgi:predicted GNAT family N-acyltransferase
VSTYPNIVIAPFNSALHHEAKGIRADVLRKPLGLPADDPAFNDKESDVHFVALDNEQVVGVVVLVPHYKKGIGKLRQMATAEKVRGKGYGIQLVKALEDYAAENGMTSIILHSRHYAAGFYEKLGYKITSDVFQEVGMDHFVMEKGIGTS